MLIRGTNQGVFRGAITLSEVWKPRTSVSANYCGHSPVVWMMRSLIRPFTSALVMLPLRYCPATSNNRALSVPIFHTPIGTFNSGSG